MNGPKISDFIQADTNGFEQVCRIARINEICEYRKFARYFSGRLMVRVRGDRRKTTGWYRFKFEKDRKALNREAGWSDKKDLYYLENPTLKN